MKDEFTTKMHLELLGDEFEELDLYIMGVYGAINRGCPKKDALAKYNIDEETYDNNIRRVLSE